MVIYKIWMFYCLLFFCGFGNWCFDLKTFWFLPEQPSLKVWFILQNIQKRFYSTTINIPTHSKGRFLVDKIISLFSVKNWKLFASKAEKWQLGKYNYSIFYHFKILKNKRGACKNDNFISNGFRATGIYSFMQSGSFAVVFVWRFLLETILLSQGAFRSFLNILV